MRTHKVGTLTLGVMLIFFGVLFLIHLWTGALTFRFIFDLWPVVFLFLGLEVLLSLLPLSNTAFRLDGWSVVLLCVLICFAMLMGAADLCLRYGWPTYWT
ncbi:MAG: hypothetical protein IJ751_06740 [Oscillospiraceae bacterium]|nr:hypothetical protein [Oscillospiraceae bacterium]